MRLSALICVLLSALVCVAVCFSVCVTVCLSVCAAVCLVCAAVCLIVCEPLSALMCAPLSALVCVSLSALMCVPLFLIPFQGEPAVMRLASETTQSCVSVRPQGLLQLQGVLTIYVATTYMDKRKGKRGKGIPLTWENAQLAPVNLV